MTEEGKIQSETKILLVDDDDDFRWATGNILNAVGYHVIHALSAREALKRVEAEIPDVVITDYRMPGMNGLALVIEMKRIIPAVPVVMITAYGEIDSAVEAMKMGVYDYVTKPVDNNDLLFTIKRALEKGGLMQEIAYLKRVLAARDALLNQMGHSDPVRKLVQQAERVAPTDFTVLIEGESGTGKELIARYIHQLSQVAGGPFVALDCGAIPHSLVENELFGSKKGAFTGADRDKPGHFEMAQGGTLFLDEVGNLPFSIQQKLLRAVQERIIRPLGGKRPLPINVRIIAATNVSFREDLRKGRFRSDLYYRLNEFSLKMPLLKERAEDIPYLAKKFLDEAETELRKKCGGFDKRGLVAMASYHWPGNVRELRNVIRQAALLCDRKAPIDTQHLIFAGQSFLSKKETKNPSGPFKASGESLKNFVNRRVTTAEKEIIGRVLKGENGNKSETARKLGVNYKTLLRKIKQLGIEV